MNIVGVDGKNYKFNPKYRKPSKRCSKLHYRARNLLTKLFPFVIIYEEVSLPGSRNYNRLRSLKADFYIPEENILIEVNGEQHYKFNTLYHKCKMEFIEQQSNDRDKKMFCELNGIRLIELPFNENNKEWEKRIREN